MRKSNLGALTIGSLTVLTGLLITVAGTGQESVSLPEMQEYVLTAGRQNFRPNESIRPRFDADTMIVVARFDPSAWWSLEEWDGDRDWYDWNKLKGLTAFWSANNKQTAMFAWRPGPTPDTWQIVAYTNDEAGGRKVGRPITVGKDDLFVGYIYWSEQEVTYRYGDQVVSHLLERPGMLRETGTWLGGADNDPQGLPYGGAAHREMRLYVGTALR